MGRFKDASGKKDSKAPPAETEEALAAEENQDFPEPGPDELFTPADSLTDTVTPLVVDGVAQDLVPADEPASRVQKMNRQYRVVGGPTAVMYNGQRINVTPGKIFTEHSVDLELLRSQGIVLQLVPETTSVMGNG